jgi:serpin B
MEGKQYMRKKFITLLLTSAMLLSFTACSKGNSGEAGLSTKDNTTEQEKTDIPEKVMWEEFTEDTTDFSISLFKNSVEVDLNNNVNVLISPTSVLFALGMTANGAEGDTLSEMQNVMWKNMNQESFNQDMEILNMNMTGSEDVSFNIANSIWVRDEADRISLKEDFAAVNKEYYNSETIKAPFDDSTVEEINNWVNNQTNGMIPTLLNDIPETAVMYLINAMAFEGTWADEYQDYQIEEDGIFTNAAGTSETVTMLNSQESCYLQDDSVTGFLKYYEGAEYAFMALLPNEDVDLAEYVAGMTGDSYMQLYNNRIYNDVNVKIPEFSNDYDTELSGALQQMGIKLAFDEAADFSRMADYKECLYISRVLHKTHIEVDRTGTKAAAVTAVETTDSEDCEPVEPKQVYLDRPFIYAIVDTQTGAPIFIGVQNSCAYVVVCR